MVHQAQFQVLDILLAEEVDLPISLVHQVVLVVLVVEVQDKQDQHLVLVEMEPIIQVAVEVEEVCLLQHLVVVQVDLV
jgi:hypothetical protein